jgi:hypothetical protein
VWQKPHTTLPERGLCRERRQAGPGKEKLPLKSGKQADSNTRSGPFTSVFFRKC